MGKELGIVDSLDCKRGRRVTCDRVMVHCVNVRPKIEVTRYEEEFISCKKTAPMRIKPRPSWKFMFEIAESRK